MFATDVFNNLGINMWLYRVTRRRVDGDRPYYGDRRNTRYYTRKSDVKTFINSNKHRQFEWVVHRAWIDDWEELDDAITNKSGD